MIEVRGLTKRYGEKVAVNDLTFGVEPGKVTGFLGPNGAGKTTTMRLILGLDYPDAGTVSVDGQRYSALANPMREVGALLDAKAVHGGRSAYNHLLCLAQTNNLPRKPVTWPGSMLNVRSLTATFSPYRFVSPRTSIMGIHPLFPRNVPSVPGRRRPPRRPR